jgi:predicted regulator of Ras-like GTPase activity (Roadblock/LC7/MglB family)
MAAVAELDDRIAKCNKILSENPNSQIFAALSEALRKKGEVDKAFRVCQTGLKIHPDYGSAHLVMAKINLDKGMYDWAEMEVRKSMEIDGNSHASDLLLSEILIHKEDYVEATKLLTKLKVAGANDVQVNRLLEFAKRLPSKQEPSVRPPSIQPTEIRPVASPPSVNTATLEREPEPIQVVPESKISIIDFLQALAEIRGVEGVMVVNHEGLMVESQWDTDSETDLFGALVTDIESTIQDQINLSQFGKYQNIMIEADDIILILRPLNQNILLIKANNRLNLGTLRLRMIALLDRLSDIS